MRAGVRSTQVFLIAVTIFSAACGGGGGTGGVQPLPPMPDFALALSATSISISQGGTSAPIDVSITPQNSFTGSVQVSFNGLPSGVTTDPASPFLVAAGQNVPVLFGAESDVSPGQFHLTAAATSGTLSHSQTISLAIQTGVVTNLPQTSFVENDSVSSLDSPPREPRRRHIVFDSANQRF
jgi:hypothetical protein